jgi:pyrroloquinoline quinone biosynthesis protein B
VRALLLGSAAGGGVPQWNCACGICTAARLDPPRVEPRTQDCLAVGSLGSWALVNCSPDIRAQLLATPYLAPAEGSRDVPVTDVLLTDAELDHVGGLLQLREGRRLRIHATAPVLGALCDQLEVDRVLASYLDVSLLMLAAGDRFRVCDGSVLVEVIPLSEKRPRYAACAPPAADWVVGYRFSRSRGPGDVSLLYAPCFGSWSPALDAGVAGADCALVDGTFWSDDELDRATPPLGGQAPGRAQQMGHLPISGPDGSLGRLGGLVAARRVYTHLNNTNPVLDPASPQRAAVARAGVEVAVDGLEVEL